MLSSLEPISNIPHYDAKETSITLQEAKKKYGIYYMDIYCLLHCTLTRSLFHPIAFLEFDCGESREESETD